MRTLFLFLREAQECRYAIQRWSGVFHVIRVMHAFGLPIPDEAGNEVTNIALPRIVPTGPWCRKLFARLMIEDDTEQILSRLLGDLIHALK
jgi:hypothetical protein